MIRIKERLGLRDKPGFKKTTYDYERKTYSGSTLKGCRVLVN